MENHSLFGMHESTSIATELVAVGEELAKTSAKVFVREKSARVFHHACSVVGIVKIYRILCT